MYIPKAMLVSVCLWTVLCLVGGCSTASIRADGSIVTHHFGYVRVIYPPSFSKNDEFYVIDTQTVGIVADRGLAFGYSAVHRESIPLDCRLVVKVANEAQYQHALEALKPFLEDEVLCLAVVKESD